MAQVEQVSPCVEKTHKNMWDDAASDCSTVDAKHSDDCCSISSSDHDDDVKTLIIFDWDDTLFPTSWLRQHGCLDGHESDWEQQIERELKVLADTVEKTLRTALLFGEVVIVTNGRQGWVEKSCADAMPSLMQILQSVKVVSAQSSYEKETQDPTEWKRLAFAHEVKQLNVPGSQLLNVISLGDSLHEQRAVMSICDFMPNCFAKSLKFADAPTIAELANQHEFVNACFPDVAEVSDHLDVEIGASMFE
jgi:hypothetical protein